MIESDNASVSATDYSRPSQGHVRWMWSEPRTTTGSRRRGSTTAPGGQVDLRALSYLENLQSAVGVARRNLVLNRRAAEMAQLSQRRGRPSATSLSVESSRCVESPSRSPATWKNSRRGSPAALLVPEAPSLRRRLLWRARLRRARNDRARGVDGQRAASFLRSECLRISSVKAPSMATFSRVIVWIRAQRSINNSRM